MNASTKSKSQQRMYEIWNSFQKFPNGYNLQATERRILTNGIKIYNKGISKIILVRPACKNNGLNYNNSSTIGWPVEEKYASNKNNLDAIH